MNRYGSIRFAHVLKRILTKRFVVLIIGNSESNHLGAQGTFNLNPNPEHYPFPEIVQLLLSAHREVGSDGT